MKRKAQKNRKATGTQDNRLFTLEVVLTSGLITEEFAARNPVVSRTIQMRGDQTLDQLHRAIFAAFDRMDEHLYEFRLEEGSGKVRRFLPPMAMSPAFGRDEGEENANHTTIGSLGIEIASAFAYWFDFGDDWWHQVNVVAVDEVAPAGKYPRITQRVGESPPQYPDLGEEYDESEEA
ncbi:MAG: hypothetical protein HYY96_02675 [Candidatus Tectomicrobia bacterium]|nr:hypothetical protein [Candidatus Tectomicrobia bacterium]